MQRDCAEARAGPAQTIVAWRRLRGDQTDFHSSSSRPIVASTGEEVRRASSYPRVPSPAVLPPQVTALGMFGFASTVALAVVLPLVAAQLPPTPSSWPHDYPGKPAGDFSPEWQSYFEVKDPLPNVTFPLAHSFAGNIGVNRPGHPNNTLFFWALEKENGSLTAAADDRSDVPWAIWLNGGPGSSSLLGFLYENGPIRMQPDGSVSQNNDSWDHLVDYIWIDQPVGTGWSTTDSDGYGLSQRLIQVARWLTPRRDEADSADRDGFRVQMGFLENLVKVFPSLKKRPLYLTGESYAGMYIPYIMKTYFGLADPPVNIVKFAIGDGTLGSEVVFGYLPTVTTLETYPQLISYDTEVFEWFREQEHLCGYDLNLTYPQTAKFPTLEFVQPSDPARAGYFTNAAKRKAAFLKTALTRLALGQPAPGRGARAGEGAAGTLARRGGLAKRDLSLRANGTIDPWYGCFIYDEMVEYALNYTFPWNVHGDAATWEGFDVYQVSDALAPETPIDGSEFYNNAKARAALHAPTSKDWAGSVFYPFLGDPVNGNDLSVEPMAFMDDLAANASAHGIPVVLYSGNEDTLVGHRGTEVVIQNTTFGGIQGFTRKPATPWFDDDGKQAGIVHQERNWTYVLVEDALTLLREFILGNNRTGLVTSIGGATQVDGGEEAALAVDALRATAAVFVGSLTTQSTFVFPSATVAAWNSYVATATATVLAGVSPDNVAGSAAANAAAGARALAAATSVPLLAGVAFVVSLFAAV
ncbi:Alpha/Beta hydrolase protein [Trametes gibbosa]|nr:Alpha/Beta hydrolase protein [Trametes gibbosa]